MPPLPFHLLSCSWPRPVARDGDRWASAPDWDPPAMPDAPRPRWAHLGGDLCWAIDWRHHFRGPDPAAPAGDGEMRGFYVVFRIRVAAAGTLVFWDDDGCVVRRGGVVVHNDPTAHMLTRHTLGVAAGDELEVAQWQKDGDWAWGARLVPTGRDVDDRPSPATVLLPYLDAVKRRVGGAGAGPPLKLYCNGAAPGRTVLAAYSLVLNGYAPSRVLLYGQEQWPPAARDLFAAALPFAEVVSPDAVAGHIAAAGGARLAEVARRHWYVMKALVALVCPPAEFCLMDDDVFVLDRVDDALAAFARHDLVYAPDMDHGGAYRRAWGWVGGRPGPLRTGRFNAGLYWMRNRLDARRVGAYALRVPPASVPAHIWEQGFIACLLADAPTLALPSQKYFFPLFDGLPGGAAGYDYAANPCGFASVHFGGLANKPDDRLAAALAVDVLGRGAG